MAPPTPAILTAPGSHTCVIDCRHGPAYAIFTALGSHTRPTIVEMNTSMTIKTPRNRDIRSSMKVGEGFIKDRLVAGDRQVDADRYHGRETVTVSISSSRPATCLASSFVGSASSSVGTALTDVMLANGKTDILAGAACAVLPALILTELFEIEQGAGLTVFDRKGHSRCARLNPASGNEPPAARMYDAIADFPEVGSVMTSGVHQKWREDGISHRHGSERDGQSEKEHITKSLLNCGYPKRAVHKVTTPNPTSVTNHNPNASTRQNRGLVV
ncbi:hypothetical protein Bbelb_203430 [Branchiostoma belcheri]|nr:hypothetical protein Bbelb_203430 [Branchiostoma belcheri]